jgi:hypothetical protein
MGFRVVAACDGRRLNAPAECQESPEFHKGHAGIETRDAARDEDHEIERSMSAHQTKWPALLDRQHSEAPADVGPLMPHALDPLNGSMRLVKRGENTSND